MLIVGAAALLVGALIWVQAFSRRRAVADAANDSTPAHAVATPPIEPPLPVIVDSGSIDSAAAESLLVDPPASTVAPPAVRVPPAIPRSATQRVPVRWGSAQALTYINVRADADPTAPIVGVITPQAKVEVGARLRGWRQVRVPGITGWADPRNLSIDSTRR
jgi:hypothetical protein